MIIAHRITKKDNWFKGENVLFHITQYTSTNKTALKYLKHLHAVLNIIAAEAVIGPVL